MNIDRDGRFDLTEVKFVDGEAPKLLQRGDVLFNNTNSPELIGKTAVISSDARLAFSNHMTRLRLESGMNPTFVARQLHYLWMAGYFRHRCKNHVNQASIAAEPLARSVPLVVPPSGEQARIADALDELLSDLDAGVAALERVRTKLKHYRAAVLKAAVEGALTAEWRRAHPATETADALLIRILVARRRRWEEAQLAKFAVAGKSPPKDWKAKYHEPVMPEAGDLPTLPDRWRWASLDQVSEIQGGLQKQPARAPRSNHYPYLRVANVLRGSLDLTELKRFELTEGELSHHRLEVGDLLVVEGNGSKTEIGRSAVWNGEIQDCVHQNHIIRVRILDGIMPRFADRFLNSPTGQRAIQAIASSTSGLHTLSVSKISKIPLAVPPLNEQEAIVEALDDQLSVIDHLERDLESRLNSAGALRQSIFRHAFTGQLVPQDPNDEPASELLKRIAAEREERARLATAAKQARPSTRTARARARKP